MLQTFRRLTQHPLGGLQKTSTFLRYLWWQISSRLWEPEQIKLWTGGLQLVVKRGYHASTACHYFGLPEFESMAFLLHFLRPGDVFVDAGANIGVYSLLASGVTKASSIAFEPDPDAFTLLSRNISLNRLEDFVCQHPVALGASWQHGLMTIGKGIQNHMTIDDDLQNGRAIRVAPLDEFCSASNTPVLMKIDVEGYETEVVRGASSTLARSTLRALIIERMGLGAQFGFDEEALHRHLLSLGFQLFDYQPFERELYRLESPAFGNNFYLRDIRFIEDRVKSATSISVRGTNI